MMQQANSDFKTETVITKDGTQISYTISGNGPRLAVVHGTFRAAKHYRKLAEFLSDKFTVYLIDRRGRMDSGSRGNNYNLQTECDDVMAVLEKHSIHLLFGHSFGGLVAANVALQYQLEKMALYEPAIVTNETLMPLEWLPRFERELQREDFVSASVTFLKGSRVGGMLWMLPRFTMKPLFHSMEKSPEWDENTKLILTVADELRLAQQLASESDRYRKISVPTLLIAGTKSPKFVQTMADAVSKLLPNCRYMTLQGLTHSAPDNDDPQQIADVLKNFF